MASLRGALMPRTSAALREGRPWYSPRVGLSSILDQASLPGRAYASLARPEGESYLDALARIAPRTDLAGYQGEGDEFAEMVLRDPGLPLGVAIGAWRGLGAVGRAVLDAWAGAATGAADQYAQGQRVGLGSLVGGAALGALPGLAMSRKAPARAVMISPEERAQNFKNWFGDSKVVDEAGNPLTVYHGTSSDFGEFDPMKAGRTYRSDRRGIFFAEDPNQAHNAAVDSRFAVGGAESIMPTNLRVERPYSPGLTTQQFDEADKAKIFRAAKRAGADGIRLEDGTWITLDPTQIKSATGNRGTFDPNDPDITHFAGTAKGPSLSSSASRRAQSLATESALRKYLREDENRKAGTLVPTGLGGFLMSAPGDTFYTRGRP